MKTKLLSVVSVIAFYLLFAIAFVGWERAKLRKELRLVSAQADEAVTNALAARKEMEADRRMAELVFRGQPKDYFSLPVGDYRIIHALDTNDGLAIVTHTNALVRPKFYFVGRLRPEQVLTGAVFAVRTNEAHR